MRETGKQAGSGCRQTAECTECLCKHYGCSLAELKQQEIKTDGTPDGDYWRLLLTHNSVKHTHTQVKNHIHTGFTGQHGTHSGTQILDRHNSWHCMHRDIKLNSITGENFPVSAAIKAFL